MKEALATLSNNGEAVSGGPTRASDNTVYLLRSLIFTGQFEAGQKLPPERQLAEDLGTSRITVRSALRALEILGFVVAKIGSRGGWWVVDPPSLARCWQDWMRANSHQIDAMLECGEAIEGEIAACAARRRTAEHLERLQTLLAQMSEAGASIGPHYAFHRTLARAAGNQYLEQAMTTIGNQLFIPSNRVILDGMDEFFGGHEAIVSAIADQDPERARQAIRTHFRFSRHVFKLDA